MDWDEIERNWAGLKGEVKHQWSKPTDEDVEFVKGKYAELLDLLQERYGHAKEKAEQEINDWAKRLSMMSVPSPTPDEIWRYRRGSLAQRPGMCRPHSACP